MACNCKKNIQFQEKYGEIVSENLTQKSFRLLSRLFFILLTIVLMVVLTPIIILVVAFQMIWGKNKGIVIPNKLMKKLKK